MSTDPSTFKQAVLKLLLELTQRFALALPFPVARALGRALGKASLLFVRREREILRAQVDFVRRYELAHSGRCDIPPPDVLAPQVFAHLGESVIEFLKLRQIVKPLPEPIQPPGLSPFGVPYDLQTFAYVTSSGGATVERLVQAKSPAVALSAHIGCFELLAAYYVLRGVPLSVIGRDSNYESLSRIVTELRKAYGIDILYRNDAQATRRIIATMRKGSFIAALIDQDTGLDSTYVPFFGLPARYPRGPIKLAIGYGAPILFSFIVRTGPGMHHVHTEEVLYEKNSPDEHARILGLFSAKLEWIIRNYPDQWLWWHRRWRRRPGIDYEHPSAPPRNTPDYIKWLDSLSGRGEDSADEAR